MPEKKLGTTAKVRVLVAEHARTNIARRIAGAVLLAIWAAFLVGEFFGFVVHPEVITLEHRLTKWSPLIVGLGLFAPDLLERIPAWIGTLKGLRITKKGD